MYNRGNSTPKPRIIYTIMRSTNGGLLYVNIAPASVSAPSTLTFAVQMG